VDHAMLLAKLKCHGVEGNFLKFIASYLNNRYQRVVIKYKSLRNCFSNWEQIKLGIPQGLSLEPLFFLLYINDLPAIIRDLSNPTLFADDIS
jgi:hypothetical protein